MRPIAAPQRGTRIKMPHFSKNVADTVELVHKADRATSNPANTTPDDPPVPPVGPLVYLDPHPYLHN